MAKTEKVTFTFTCDVCGKDIADEDQDGAHHKIIFGMDKGSATYEIDLCKIDQAKLTKAEKALSPFLLHRVSGTARRRAAGTATRRPRRSSGRRRGGDASAIREWARAQGYEVSDRGRISKTIRDAYAQAS